MKRITVYAIVILSLLLSGCSTVDEYYKNAIFDKAEIAADSDYQEYESLNENGKLNDSGEIVDAESFDENESASTRSGAIHITFADNSHFLVNYFLDEEKTKKIDIADCYLNPGDCIYADIVSINNTSNMFGLSCFVLTEYDDNSQIKSQSKLYLKENLVYSIPEDCRSTELLLAPIGEYYNRELTLLAYYIDDNGNRVSLGNSGKWFINEEECRGNSATISPVVSYVLKYDYDENNYFYISSEPDCFTEFPNSVGIVEFWAADPTEDLASYSVELHPYLSVSISTEDGGTLAFNENKAESIKKGKTWSNNRLRYGDRIVIETSGGCTITNGDYKHVHVDKDPIVEGYRYTLTMTPELNSDTQEKLNVHESISINLPASAAHGKCAYKLDKSTVEGSVHAQTNQTLTITYTITDSDFRFGDGNFFNHAWNWGQDLLGNMSRSVTIQISSEMNNTTIDPDEWFFIVRKGE